VPHHLFIGVLAGCASKDQTGDSLMVLGQGCRMGLAMVSVQICDGLSGLFSLWPGIMEEQYSDIFIVVRTQPTLAFRLLNVLFCR